MADAVTRTIIRLGEAAKNAQTKRDESYKKLSAAVQVAVNDHGMSQAEAARHAQVDRQTVRNWLGKGKK